MTPSNLKPFKIHPQLWSWICSATTIYSATPSITLGKDTKSGGRKCPNLLLGWSWTWARLPSPSPESGPPELPGNKLSHTANSWTHTANPGPFNSFHESIPGPDPLRHRLQASDDGFVARPRSGHRGLWLNRHRGLCQLGRGHRIWHHRRGLWHLLPRHLRRPLAKPDEK